MKKPSACWLLVLLALPLAHRGQAQVPSFAPLVSYPTGAGSGPFGVCLADVNADGKPDLLTANYNNSAGVLLGNGDGTFQAMTGYDTGPRSQPVAIAVADVNGDGRPDLLTANSGSISMGVLLGTGQGRFGSVATYLLGIGSGPRNIAVADANADGHPDLLVATGTGSLVGVLLGSGTGTFRPVVYYDAGYSSYPADVALADVTGDGYPDLLTANYSSNSVGVLPGTGTGSFGSVIIYPLGSTSFPNSIAVADVNGDGYPDLLTADTNESVSVLLNGGGVFLPATTYPTGKTSYPSSIRVADVNGDGHPDLLTATSTANAVGILLGNGDGTFQPQRTYGTGARSNPVALAVADVNGDGRPDLLTANLSANAVGVLLNSTSDHPLATAGALAAEQPSVYPNPAQAGFQVHLPGVAGASEAQIVLLNSLGQAVMRQVTSLPATGTTLHVAAEELPAGAYLLRLTAGATTRTLRMLLR